MIIPKSVSVSPVTIFIFLCENKEKIENRVNKIPTNFWKIKNKRKVEGSVMKLKTALMWSKMCRQVEHMGKGEDEAQDGNKHGPWGKVTTLNRIMPTSPAVRALTPPSPGGSLGAQ